MLIYSLLTLLTWAGAIIGGLVCIACTLYWIAELVEEYTARTAKIISWLIMVTILTTAIGADSATGYEAPHT